MKYSQLSTSYKAYEICFYWADENGIETLEGLYNWEASDMPNNKLYEVSDCNKARSIIDNNKLLKQYV